MWRSNRAGIDAVFPSVVWIFTYNQSMQTHRRLPYVWDYDLDQQQFQEILDGRLKKRTAESGLGCTSLAGIRSLR